MGKLTVPVVAPVCTNFVNALATSRPMAACASDVEPPTCGVRMTLGSFCRGVVNPSLLDSGSSG